jgi:hypothetical protein
MRNDLRIYVFEDIEETKNKISVMKMCHLNKTKVKITVISLYVRDKSIPNLIKKKTNQLVLKTLIIIID